MHWVDFCVCAVAVYHSLSDCTIKLFEQINRSQQKPLPWYVTIPQSVANPCTISLPAPEHQQRVLQAVRCVWPLWMFRLAVWWTVDIQRFVSVHVVELRHARSLRPPHIHQHRARAFWNCFKIIVSIVIPSNRIQLMPFNLHKSLDNA